MPTPNLSKAIQAAIATTALALTLSACASGIEFAKDVVRLPITLTDQLGSTDARDASSATATQEPLLPETSAISPKSLNLGSVEETFSSYKLGLLAKEAKARGFLEKYRRISRFPSFSGGTAYQSIR